MKLSGLYVYPIKSCGGIALDEAILEPRGLAFDRRWMLIDARGRFLSQRTFPALARVRVALMDDGLRVTAPDHEALHVPMRPEGERLPVTVWGDALEAVRVSDAADAWFRAVLGVPCRLVHQPDDALRPTDPAYSRAGDHTSLADAFPLLLATTASLADLNARLEAPVPIDRFRPNLVIDGTEAFAEDDWREIRIGELRFRVVKGCARCAVVTTDQQTGTRAKEPLRTLATYRKRNGKTLFGQNLIPDALGTLRIGDPVAVLTTRVPVA